MQGTFAIGKIMEHIAHETVCMWLTYMVTVEELILFMGRILEIGTGTK